MISTKAASGIAVLFSISLVLTWTAVQAQQSPRRTINVYEGQGVRLVCNASATNVRTEYQWEKPAGNVISREYILYLPKVSYTDTGVYVCRAFAYINGARVESSEATQLALKDSDDVLNIGGGGEDDERPANLVFQGPIPGNVKSMEAGSLLYQTCRVDPDDTSYSYRWIGPDGRSQLSDNNFIYIQQLNPSHAGTYTCVATHKQTRKEERISFQLLVSAPAPSDNVGGSDYSIIIDSEPAEAIYKKPLTLTCRTNPNLPSARYQWYVNNVPNVASQTLYISSAEKKDLSSTYECRVTSSGVERVQAFITQMKPHPLREELNLKTAPGPHFNVRRGEKRELHCEIERFRVSEGVRGKDAQWYFNGELLDAAKLRQYNADRVDRIYVTILALNAIDLNNEGQYECRIRNVVKEAFLVVIDEGSKIAVSPPVLNADENDPIEFHCRISNLPGVDNTGLTWFFLGKSPDGPRQPLRREWQYSTPASARETGFISLENAQVSDDGYYLCVAPGGLNAVGQLIVTAKAPRNPPEVIVSPRELRTRPGRPFTVECSATLNGVPYGTPSWRFVDRRPISSDRRFTEIPLSTGRSQLQCSGLNEYENNTQVECYVDLVSDISKIYLENPCDGPNTFRCRSGRCIDQSLRCNQYNDCGDNSDEDPAYCAQCDPLEVKCDYYNGERPTKLTFSASWQCDGENDCGNNFDESKCFNTGPSCGGTSFDCGNGMVIPRAFVCDKEADCSNNRDEESCSNAPIIRAQPRETYVRRARQYETVTFKCIATGNPMPKVIWRFNWRCLPDKDRMTFTEEVKDCSTVESTITIRNVRPGDDGIYNCEALAANQRTISDDYQLALIF